MVLLGKGTIWALKFYKQKRKKNVERLQRKQVCSGKAQGQNLSTKRRVSIVFTTQNMPEGSQIHITNKWLLLIIRKILIEFIFNKIICNGFLVFCTKTNIFSRDSSLSTY